MADDDRARRRRLRRQPLQPGRPADPVAGQPADLAAEIRRRGRSRVVVVRLDPDHPRLLGGAKADREDRAERDRHLPEDLADVPLADDALDPVRELDRLDLALEQAEERALAALRRRVLARQEADVGGGAGEPLALGELESREDRDRSNVVRSDHQRQRYSPDGADARGAGHSSSARCT